MIRERDYSVAISRRLLYLLRPQVKILPRYFPARRTRTSSRSSTLPETVTSAILDVEAFFQRLSSPRSISVFGIHYGRSYQHSCNKQPAGRRPHQEARRKNIPGEGREHPGPAKPNLRLFQPTAGSPRKVGKSGYY